MFSIISEHKKVIIGIVALVLIFIGYSIFMPDKGDTTGNLTRQNTTGTTGTAADPNSPGRQFVSQLLAIQNIHYNLELFDDPAYLFLQDYSRELTPQEVGRQNPFAPLEGGTGFGSGSFVTENGAGFVTTSTTTPRTATTTTSTSTRR